MLNISSINIRFHTQSLMKMLHWNFLRKIF